jgi:hypothetical protein
VGVERVVRFAAAVPEWPAVVSKLIEVGETPAVRMIDGLPAFPDELPGPDWQEVRVGLAGGMVTLRRSASDVRVVTWGTSEPALVRSWDRFCWAVAAAGEGVLVLPEGPQSAAAFRSSVLVYN